MYLRLNIIINLTWYTVLLSLMTVIVGCSSPSASTNGLNVVTSIYPMEYFAKRIGGDLISVTNLIPNGVDPHNFALTPKDLVAISDAHLIIANGLQMEPWLAQVIGMLDGNNGPVSPRIIETASLLPNGTEKVNPDEHADEHADEHDPHVWLDPIQAIGQAKVITEALVSIDPKNRTTYEKNFVALTNDLESLHSEFTLRLTGCKHQQFIVSHAAFGHLADRYGLEQIAISGISHGSKTTAGRLAAIESAILRNNIKTILTTSPTESGVVNVLARDSSTNLRMIHSLESVPESELSDHDHYFGLMTQNLEALAEAIGCDA